MLLPFLLKSVTLLNHRYSRLSSPLSSPAFVGSIARPALYALTASLYLRGGRACASGGGEGLPAVLREFEASEEVEGVEAGDGIAAGAAVAAPGGDVE